jgi:hypothetical protein
MMEISGPGGLGEQGLLGAPPTAQKKKPNYLYFTHTSHDTHLTHTTQHTHSCKCNLPTSIPTAYTDITGAGVDQGNTNSPEGLVKDGVVVIPIEDMGILLTHSNLFEKVRLQDVWKNLLTALTCPPTDGNLRFLEGEDYEMDFGENYGKEAGLNAGLPPNK